MTEHKAFDTFILFMILMNSLMLALTDYGHVNGDGEPDPRYSSRNEVIGSTEIIFTTVFAVECVLKIISLGFVQGPGAYLKDGWNCLDFFVVAASIIAVLPGMPNISVLRTFRVMRPLRSVSAMPKLKIIISGLLKSIPSLINVTVLLMFTFTIFGILGLQLYQGLLHARCRATPFPIQLPSGWEHNMDVLKARTVAATLNATDYKCISQPNNHDSWTQSTSPWLGGHDCYWPLAAEELDNERVCTGTEKARSGGYECPGETLCGSNYDIFGNERFNSAAIMESYAYGDFTAGLNFGYTNFDNMANAFLTIFQSVTMEGWVDIMYQVQDGHSHVFTAIFFAVLIVFGSFFFLNLFLAVLGDALENQDEEEAEEQERVRRVSVESNMDDDSSSPTNGLVEVKQSKSTVARIVENKWFGRIIVFLIGVNTVVLSLDHYPTNEVFDKRLEVVNFLLLLAFTVEMVLKLAGLGLKEYRSDTFNLFDGFIVIVGWVEFAVLPPTFVDPAAAGGGGALSALRTFRLFRVFKLARDWHSLRILLQTIVETLGSVANFAVLLMLFMYIYSLMGMQFFANKFHFYPIYDSIDETRTDPYDPNFNKVIPYSTCSSLHTNQPSEHCAYDDATLSRAHFDDLLWSFTTIFQILSGENWNAVMYDMMRATSPVGSAVYMLSLIIFGQFIIMNIFLAILLGGFDGNEDEAKIDTAADGADAEAERKGAKASAKVEPLAGDDGWATHPEDIGGTTNKEDQLSPSGITTEAVFDDPDDDANTEGESTKVVMTESSLWIFGKTSSVRRYFWNLTTEKGPTSTKFDNGILCLIVLSSLTLAIDNPLFNPESDLVKGMTGLDILMTTLFTLEMIFKIIAQGLFMKGPPKLHPSGRVSMLTGKIIVVEKQVPYLRDAWGILDFIIVFVSILTLAAAGNPGLKSLRALRTLRVLRPLRMISRNQGMKLVVNSLFRAVPAVFNVVIVCMLFLLIFAIVGVNYFKGNFYACNAVDQIYHSEDAWFNEAQSALLITPMPFNVFNAAQNATFSTLQFTPACSAAYTDGMYKTVAPTSRWVCECSQFANSAGDKPEWVETLNQNFNNVGNAIGLLFEASTTEGWVDMMLAGIDAVGIDMQPIRNAFEGWAFFYIAIIVVLSFFVMQLFVGVIIDNFNTMNKELSNQGSALITKEQQDWIAVQKSLLRIDRHKAWTQAPVDNFGIWAFSITEQAKFDSAIMVCIMMNTILMAADHFGQGENFQIFLEFANYLFALIFTIEAILKLAAYKRKAYFAESWNRFDFLIVCGTNIGLVIKWATGMNIGSIATVIRTFRIGRIFRLINGAKGLRQLFNTLILTLPSLSNIGGLLILLMFIYAVLGVQLFAKIALQGDLTAHANFQDFWGAMMVCLRASTGENWNGMMYAMADSPPGCISNPEYHPNMCGMGCSTCSGDDQMIRLDPCLLMHSLNVTDDMSRDAKLSMASSLKCCIPLDGCGTPAAIPYWVSFTLIITFIKLNLFIAVVLDAFGQADEDDVTLDEESFAIFIRAWRRMDPEKRLRIKASQVELFVGDVLEPPLGLKGVEFKSVKDKAAAVKRVVEYIPIRPTSAKSGRIVVGESAIRRPTGDSSKGRFKQGDTVQFEREKMPPGEVRHLVTWLQGIIVEVQEDGQFQVEFSDRLESSPAGPLMLAFHDVSLGLAKFAWTDAQMQVDSSETGTVGGMGTLERAKTLRDIHNIHSTYDDHHGPSAGAEFDVSSYLAAKTLIKNYKISRVRKAVEQELVIVHNMHNQKEALSAVDQELAMGTSQELPPLGPPMDGDNPTAE
jgi:hypothetical protein